MGDPKEEPQTRGDLTYTDADVERLWPQAAGELAGFARALERSNSGITAAQLRMAIALANEAAAMRKKTVEVKVIPEE